MKNIVLIGMPGCGKTTIGKLLAERLHKNFCDIDKYIEQNTKKSIPEIFKEGEDVFRKIEREAVKEVSKESSMVISTGGGVVKSFINIKNLRKNGVVIFVNRAIEEIVSDIDIRNRPLVKDGKEKLYKLYEERIDLYKKYCDYEVINHATLESVVDGIVNMLGSKK
ncbi:MAG: shikimate kinase [Marinisporobacter sp.]|jgi:shikimate kinase|nr:shikimate kinase [Marinisporobacter sp.]